MKIGGATGAWDRPAVDPIATFVLGHGAGGDLNDPLLRGLAKALAANGCAVLRFNFPYRDAGRKAPGSQKQSEDCYRSVASEARTEGTPLFCGGKSYGGRIASHIAADGFEMRGLVFVSYPLHPPGHPERLRDEHLHGIEAPMLFVQGTRDPFATPELLERTVDSLPHATLIPIEGGDHSLRVRGRSPGDVLAAVTESIETFLRTQTS